MEQALKGSEMLNLPFCRHSAAALDASVVMLGSWLEGVGGVALLETRDVIYLITHNSHPVLPRKFPQTFRRVASPNRP
jgi:hypothetical protein